MGLRESVLSTLQGDTTLMGVLTGGAYTVMEISHQNTPGAYDTNLELKPCALVRMGMDSTVLPYHNGTRTMINVLLYQRAGRATIDSARDRVYALLHEKKVGAKVWQMLHVSDALDLEDGALAASMHIMTFEAIRGR